MGYRLAGAAASVCAIGLVAAVVLAFVRAEERRPSIDQSGRVAAALGRIEGRLAALETEDTARRLREATERARPGPSSAGPLAPPKEPAPAGDEEGAPEPEVDAVAAGAARLAPAEFKLKNEVRDAAWAVGAERYIENTLSKADVFPGTTVRSVQCGQTLCRIEVSHADVRSRLVFVHRAATSLGTTLPIGSIRPSEKPDVSIAFFAREGYDLPI